MPIDPAAHWVHRSPARTACFQTSRAVFIDRPSAHRRLTASSSSRPTLLFGAPSPILPALSFRTDLDLPGSFSRFATSHRRSHITREVSQSPLRSALRFSQPLGGLLRTCARGPIPSRCHVPGSFCSRASHPAQPPFLLGRSLPPCRCCAVASRAPSAFAENTALPRATPLGFEAFIHARPRSASPVIHLARSRSLPQFSPLRVSSPGVGPNLLRTSAHDVREPDLHVRAHRPFTLAHERATRTPALTSARSPPAYRHRETQPSHH
jgi:hypothetical protein